jgi:hypothetical protein
MVSWQNSVLCISNFTPFKVLGNLKLTQWSNFATKCFATRSKFFTTMGWKHGKIYENSYLKTIKLEKKAIFHENARKYIKILLKFHFETIEPLIGFIVNQLQNFKKNGIIKVRNM